MARANGFCAPRGDLCNVKAEFPELNDRDLKSLPHEWRISPKTGYNMKLYAHEKLMDLEKRKCTALGKPIPALKRPPWLEHVYNAQPPPVRSEAYTSPSRPAVPDPENIIWKPSKILGPVTVEDACRLYCLDLEDFEHLSSTSRWIDLPTVAKRALTLHGGFYAHKQLVLQRRMEEEEELEKADKDESYFTFSATILAELEATNTRIYDNYDDTVDQTAKDRRVAVLYPIKCFWDDNGCSSEWEPCETLF
ncbi:hypothetical protein C8R43DRAFT_1015646 [Mycena crocata]|nr:hypothetical protein C8R43DRAFT_1015646 [Mycena crocata]